ncbi:hypothetical protein HAL_25410 [Haladaptatus sp. T7]|nr:hypothetical protein HAL_25410 [Haladaptatus sp. T7]
MLGGAASVLISSIQFTTERTDAGFALTPVRELTLVLTPVLGLTLVLTIRTTPRIVLAVIDPYGLGGES